MRPVQAFAVTLIFAMNSHAKTNVEGVHRASLIAESHDFERLQEESYAFLEDTAVTAYLNQVLQSLGKTNPKVASCRVRILKSPVFNAFAIPHGVIYVNTGLLALMRNEAQLAALLGHEVTHILNDHIARNLVQAKKSALASAQLRIGLDFFIGSFAGSITGVALRSAITGYSRDLEREADSCGLRLMMKAGYAPVEFRNFFLLTKSRIERDKIKVPFFFSTHPAISERISNYYTLVGKDTASAAQGRRNADEYSRIIAPILLYDGIGCCAAGKFDIAERNFSRVLHADSCNARAFVFMGVCKRLEGTPRSDQEEVASYRQAARCDPSFHEAERELGFHYFKSGVRDSAAYYLKLYKTASPGSPFMPVVEDYLKQCER
jgi:beta-barrel assembly-enhancing protease